jgi:hypothetical protein
MVLAACAALMLEHSTAAYAQLAETPPADSQTPTTAEPSTATPPLQPSIDEPELPHSHDRELAYLLRTARNAATESHCDSVAVIGDRVRSIEPTFYATTFATDPTFATCKSVPGRKDPWTALSLSAAATLAVPTGLFLVGGLMFDDHQDAASALILGGVGAFLVGPTVGHIYSGHAWNPWLGVRLASLAAPIVGVALDFATGAHGGRDFAPPPGLAIGVLAGVATYAVGMVGEIASAPFAARDYNREHHLDLQLTIAPIQSKAGLAPGIGLVGHL